MVNLSSLELHPYLHRVGAPERPTTLVFDLDPGRPADLTDACRVGLVMRRLLEQTGLDCYPKTSGGKGLHIYVPLNSRVTYERTKRFARAVAETLARDDPDDVTSVMAKEKRTGKVFIDWSQNDEHKTTVAVYSLRARHRPTVSAPLHWDEVERGAGLERGATGPAVEIGPAVERVERLGDLFLPVLEQQQELPD
jgi:bifunctional non-homologous end joining protein LigD